MVRRRPLWLWGFVVVVCLTGVLGGPALCGAGEFVWASVQPQTVVSGWNVVAILALFGLVWLGMVCVIARALRGKAGLAFAVAAIAVAAATVAFEKLQSPTETIRFTLTGDEAAAWKDFRP